MKSLITFHGQLSFLPRYVYKETPCSATLQNFSDNPCGSLFDFRP